MNTGIITYYKKAAFNPSIITLVAIIIFSIIDNYNYKSEWMTAGTIILLSIITAFIYCLIISVLSTTIFLNKYPAIKENRLMNFLSWFLLPFGFIMIALIHEISFKIKYNEKIEDDFVYTLILNVPFIFGLVWTYIKYRKTNY
jgi:hypothetical protein